MAINSHDYQAYRKQMIEAGTLFQDFAMEVLAKHANLIVQVYGSKQFQYHVGETRQGAEIKFDDRYNETNNLFIEMGEKAQPREGDYVKSGIYRNDNSWLYVQGNYDVLFVFQKNLLQMLVESGKFRVIENGTKTARGFLLPGKSASKYAGLIVMPGCDEVIRQSMEDFAQLGRELRTLVNSDRNQGSLF